MNTIALLASVMYVGHSSVCQEVFYQLDTPINPTRRNRVAQIEIMDEMRFEFDIIIHSFPTGWANIFHCGSSDSIRQPGIWIYPESDTSGHYHEGFHISFSTTTNWNPWINPGPELTTEQSYNFVLEVTQTQLTVIIDGTVVYDEPHDAHNTGIQPCYVSDPWYVAADVTVSNLVISAPKKCRYEASTIRGNYRQVRGDCMANGGDLAKFDSLDDVEKIYTVCEATGYPGGGCYVGFNDVRYTDRWRWVDGTQFDGWIYTDDTFQRANTPTSSLRCGFVYIPDDIETPIEDAFCDNIPGYGICEYPTDTCDCFGVTLISSAIERIAGNACYQYQANFCNDIDTVRFGIANFDSLCGFDLLSAFKSIQPPRLGVDLITTGMRGSRGIEISGLSDGDIFRLCFDGTQVGGTMAGGNIAFDDGEDSDVCRVIDTLPGFCPGTSSQNDFVVGMVGEDAVKTVNTVNEEPMMMMSYVWTAIISAIVSIVVVIGAYILCIKPSRKSQIYDKLVLDEEEEDAMSL